MDKDLEEAHRAGPIGAELPAEEDAGFPPTIIDLGAHRAGRIDESWLTMFGGAVEMLMKGLFSGRSVPVKVRGNRSEVNAFTKALSKEKNYLQSLMDYGLDNPRTYKNKAVLDKAVAKFERATGLKWPYQG